MKKYALDLTVNDCRQLNDRYALLRLTGDTPLPEMHPGQFVQVRIDETPDVMLRRPISICLHDQQGDELWLLVAAIGPGTRWLASRRKGDKINCLLPLGNAFTLDTGRQARPLLVGGGVGVAPMLFLGREFSVKGIRPTFLLGARKAEDLLLLDDFSRYGEVFTTTEDGSHGEKGRVTDHSIWSEAFTSVATCGPKPMMAAVADMAHRRGWSCEVSLENLMACGIGACLCCVEKTTTGNRTVCTQGPVINTQDLLWQN